MIEDCNKLIRGREFLIETILTAKKTVFAYSIGYTFVRGTGKA